MRHEEIPLYYFGGLYFFAAITDPDSLGASVTTKMAKKGASFGPNNVL